LYALRPVPLVCLSTVADALEHKANQSDNGEQQHGQEQEQARQQSGVR